MDDEDVRIGVLYPIADGDARRARVQACDFGRYIGGEAEIHTQGGVLHGGAVYRGNLESIGVDGDELKMRFARLRVMRRLAVWEDDARRDYSLTLELVSAVQGPDERGRLILQSPIVEELLVLFPPGYERG
ncbi:MAG TPA: hypothetical protein VFF06_00540 [Polyangia bacterium]|nr:hypothetical protein [Polyangia bacterium]